MDSYEYYLLFHKDSTQFFNHLVQNDDEILIALDKLLANGKVIYISDKDACFEKVWSLKRCETNPSEKLDENFESLLTIERMEIVTFWTLENLEKFDETQNDIVKSINLFRVIRAIIRKGYKEMTDYMKKLSMILIEITSLGSNNYTYLIVSILKSLMKEHPELSGLILSEIYLRSSSRQNKHSLQSLCLFQ